MGIALAHADPLGVNQDVTLDEVGGLDERELHSAFVLLPLFSLQSQDINPLKEMTLPPIY